jgi:hypothetical protein
MDARRDLRLLGIVHANKPNSTLPRAEFNAGLLDDLDEL